jgi:hypothetical protein
MDIIHFRRKDLQSGEDTCGKNIEMSSARDFAPYPYQLPSTKGQA